MNPDELANAIQTHMDNYVSSQVFADRLAQSTANITNVANLSGRVAQVMDVPPGRYIDWGNRNSGLLTHRYVTTTHLMRICVDSMNERFTTNGGRENIRAAFMKLIGHEVNSINRFPNSENNIFINVNNRVISNYIMRVLNSCDFGERSLDHTENTTQKKYSSIDDAKQMCFN